jgi:sortase (surface protein transpeptidase)
VTARHWRIRWPVAALITGLALAGGAAAGYAVSRPPNHDYGAVPPPSGYHAVVAVPSHGGQTATAVPAATPSTSKPGAARVRSTAPAVTVAHVPTQLRIPAIGVDAPVLPIGVEAGGALGIPPDPSDVGWWAGGAFPGEATGAVIIAGHIDSAVSGPGALLRLQDVRPGEDVTVTAAGHAYRYQVTALRAYAKANLPVAAVFGEDVTARLVIVSCGGPFDAATGHYLDNIVAYAVPAGG